MLDCQSPQVHHRIINNNNSQMVMKNAETCQ